jgi:hypothetical protein
MVGWGVARRGHGKVERGHRWGSAKAGLTARRCWNYKVMGSQRSYLKGLIDDRDDTDDGY